MRRFFALVLVVAISAGGIGYYAGGRQLLTPAPAAATTAACITFPETGKQLCDRFLEYWQANGGLAQQGLPLSNVFPERSAVNGQTYHVQYFERAVFELHPKNARPYDVLLSLLGREKYLAQYPKGEPSAAPLPPAPSAAPPAANCSPAYPTVCIPPPPPDLDCKDISYRNFTVLAPDPHKFDSDKDGIGCES